MIDSTIVLDRMIAKILLLEEAQARNITITMTEVEEEITSMYVQSGLSQAQFEEKLEEIHPQWVILYYPNHLKTGRRTLLHFRLEICNQ
jgi:hypothetical protein